MVACVNVAKSSGNYNSGGKRKVTQQSTYISEKRKERGVLEWEREHNCFHTWINWLIASMSDCTSTFRDRK